MAMPPIQRSVTLRNSRQSRPAGCSSTPERWSGMLTHPCTRLSSCSSCCSFTELAVGLTCCAWEGADVATSSNNVQAPSARRTNLAKHAINFPPRSFPAPSPASGLDGLAIGGLPSPGARAVTASGHPLLVDLGDDFAVAREQRFGRTHFGTKRQLALGEPVRAILLVFFLAAVDLRPAGAERALVHLAA